MKSPGITAVVNGKNKTLYMTYVSQTKDNLRKKLAGRSITVALQLFYYQNLDIIVKVLINCIYL